MGNYFRGILQIIPVYFLMKLRRKAVSTLNSTAAEVYLIDDGIHVVIKNGINQEKRYPIKNIGGPTPAEIQGM